MSTQTQRTVIGVVIIAFVVLTMGIILFMPPDSAGGTTTTTTTTTTTEGPVILDPVPPSQDPPENSTSYETIILGSMILNATGNITGMIPHSGPITFNMYLMINVTNNGTEDITDFHAIKMSLYYQSSGLFYTFSLTPDTNVTIAAGQTVTLTYQNQETSLDTSFSLTSPIYARVLVSFDIDQECILTTPTLEGLFAIE